MVLDQRVNEYLEELSKHLKELPKAEREAVIEEIEVHLKDKVEALKTRGYSDEEAIKKVLSDFKTPHSLSKELLVEYDETALERKPTLSFFILSMGVSGLAFLSLPILETELELAWIILGGFLTVCGLIKLLSSKQFQLLELGVLKVSLKLIITLYFPASLLFLWIVFKQNEGMVLFSLYYMFVYWLVLVLYGLITKIKLKELN